MGAAQRKVNHWPALGGMDAARGFSGDERLQMELIDDERLDDLGLNDRRGDFQNRFVFKKYFSFRNRPNVAREAELGEIMQKFVGKLFLPG